MVVSIPARPESPETLSTGRGPSALGTVPTLHPRAPHPASQCLEGVGPGEGTVEPGSCKHKVPGSISRLPCAPGKPGVSLSGNRQTDLIWRVNVWRPSGSALRGRPGPLGFLTAAHLTSLTWDHHLGRRFREAGALQSEEGRKCSAWQDGSEGSASALPGLDSTSPGEASPPLWCLSLCPSLFLWKSLPRVLRP